MEEERLEGEAAAGLRAILSRTRRLVFFGGAGVSTASGIPDFRSPEGLGARAEDGLTPETALSKDFFWLQPERFFDYYRRHMLYPEARPNAAHRWLYGMERRDVLRGIVTQNVDGLHRLAGNRRVYELHGSVHENECLDCGARWPMELILRSEGIPRCRHCGGVVKPSVVLYGEPLPPYVLMGARREIATCDTLMAAGTSLTVEPAASLLEDFQGRHLVVINREPTPADGRADLVIRGDVAEVLGALGGENV